MFKPIIIVEETEDTTVYEYKTVFLWILYAILLVMIVGFAAQIQIVSLVGFGLMVVYFFTVSIKYLLHGRDQPKSK